MMKHSIKTTVCVLLLIGLPGPLAAQDPAVLKLNTIPSGISGYEKQIQPFFRDYCFKCHGPTNTKGNISLHSLGGITSSDQNLDSWESIVEILKFGDMPPIDEPQPQDEEVQAIISWIEAGLSEAAE